MLGEQGSVTARQLAELPYLSECSAEFLELLIARISIVNVPQGSKLTRQLLKEASIFLICSGSVRIYNHAETGRLLTYQLLSAGEMFGELSAIDNEPRTATVVAEEDSVIGRLSQADFQQLIHSEPEFAWLVLHRLSRLARWLTARVYEYHNYGVSGRICAELLRSARVNEHGKHFIELGDRDMASRVGTTRANVTRIFSQLRKLGCIQRIDKGIEILDREQLQQQIAMSEFS